MELSKAIASIAVVLGVIVAAGYAQGQGEGGEGATRQTGQERIQEREAERRAAVLEQEKRKADYERACKGPLKTDSDLETCRSAYKRLQVK